jgi:TM2 domain-containing membrane protein YozV
VLTPSEGPPGNGLNGWARLLGLVGVPGLIVLYLIWWVTSSVGGKLDRIIQLLELIARALKVRLP